MSGLLAALFCGVLFGFGLALGGMLDPEVIRGFLDFAGDFDPRLGFVFAGALAVSAPGYAVSRRLRRPLIGARFPLSNNQAVDAPLIGGATLFGLGWGMVGLCPGPAMAGLALGLPRVAVFVVAMLAGMFVHEILMRPDQTPSALPRA